MSGFSTYMRLCNATPLAIERMETTGARDEDWGSATLRETQLHKQSIPAWKDVKNGMVLKSGAKEVKFKLDVIFAGGDRIRISINQHDADTEDSAKKQTSVKEEPTNRWRYGVMQRSGYWDGYHQTQYIITVLYENDQWMGAFWEKIGHRPFREICMVGAHDAGMSTITASTLGANGANTRTQSKNIQEQLEYGVRYFDLRPAIWPSKTKDAFYMGHMQEVAGKNRGGLGESLDSVIEGVRTFYDQPEHQREVAILKFRSWDSIDDPHGFTDAQKDAFIARIEQDLGPLMFKAQPDDATGRFDLGNVTPQQVIDSGARIVCVFEKLNTKDKKGNTTRERIFPEQGIFKYGDYKIDNSNPFPAADLLVADNYSNVDTRAAMTADQLDNYRRFESNGSALFLLSWTLTEWWFTAFINGLAVKHTTIESLAKECNPYLWFTVWDQIASRNLKSAKTMNVLFADFVGGNLTNDCACAVNSFLAR